MKDRKGFTLIELLVVIAIIGLLLSIIVPSLKKAKILAQQTVSKSNLRQWGLVWKTYTDNYDSKFPYWKVIGDTYHRGNWIQPMRDYFPSREKMLLCPTATQVDPQFIQPDGSFSPNAHGSVRYAYAMGAPTAAEIQAGITRPELCSYGMNNWCSNSSTDTTPVQGRPTTELWQTFPSVMSPSQVPMMLDSMWRGGGPQNVGVRIQAPVEANRWAGFDAEISHFCIPRHARGHVNSMFVDLHVDDISLKSLWGLKWHRSYNTGTLPPNAWPAWMNDLN